MSPVVSYEKRGRKVPPSDWQKTRFYTFVEPRKGLGNEACPKCNPQSELTSDEENSTFQGIFMPMECAVYTYSNLVKILILTKGVDFFDTLKRGLEVPPFLCPFLCRLLHALYNGFVCRHRNHLQMLVSASGRCFCLLYEPPQSRSSLLRSQTNDGCMPCHHHSTIGDTGNFHQGFLYLLGTFFGIFRHCRQTGGCLLPCTAAKEETERKNNIFFQISTPISLLTYPRKLLSLHGKSSCFFRKKTVYHRTFVLQ